MNEGRYFTKSERDALFLAADGKSDASGRPLGDDWHADHTVPWCRGGKTDVANGQALTAAENLAKGNKQHSLREWQQEFVERFSGASSPDFLLCALPGGGKTVAALHVAQGFLSGGGDRKIVVVVPTSYLKRQWKDEAWGPRFLIPLQNQEFRGTLKDGCVGVVTTYSAVASNPYLFRRLCSLHQCFVIFDEIHHAADQTSWGGSILNAFEMAKFRLCLSGTPFRSDGKKIPFLAIEPDGRYRVDYQYDYPRALRDEIVRSVAFHRYSGSVTIACREGQVWDFHTDDDLDETDSGRRLRGLLQHPTFTGGLLQCAHEKLMEVRQIYPSAGGLVVCMSTQHAIKVAKLLEEITGEAPDIVVSDEDASTGSIDAFRKSRKRWLVAVRMVSEGVDIKRLMVLAYLTNVKTQMSFRQTIGRVVRRMDIEDTESYCIMPDDPDLSEMAKAIEEVQFQVLTEDTETDRRRVDSAERSASGPDMSVLDSTSPTLAGSTISGKDYAKARAAQIAAMASKHGVAEGKMAAIYAELLGDQHASQYQSFQQKDFIHPEDALKKLRRQITKLVPKLAYEKKVDFKDIHIQYKRNVDNTPQDSMTKEQLERKCAWLSEQIAQAKAI